LGVMLARGEAVGSELERSRKSGELRKGAGDFVGVPAATSVLSMKQSSEIRPALILSLGLPSNSKID
jgi:hypothetical protein